MGTFWHGFSVRKCVVSLFILLCVIFNFNLFGAIEFPPQLTPEQYQNYENGLLNTYPWLEEARREAGNGNVAELASIIQYEQQLLNELRSNPQYMALASAKTDPITITVEQVERTMKKVKVAIPDAINKFKERLKETMDSLAEHSENLREHVLQEIYTLLESFLDQNPYSMVVGIADALEDEQKREFLELGSLEAQIQYIRESNNFSDEALKENFRADAFGISEDDLNIEQIATLLETQVERQAKLKDYIRVSWFLHYLYMEEEIEGGSLESLQTILNELPDNFYDVAGDKAEEFQSFLGGLVQINETDSKSAKKELKKYQKYLKKIYKSFENESQRVEVTQVRNVLSSFRIVEVQPSIGIFRGFPGGDCSTTSSWAFPYSPYERVFYVFDEEDRIRGYIGAAQTEVNGTNNFYVHDATGRKMTTDMDELALHAMFKAKSLYNAVTMTLATDSVTANLSHQEHLMEMLRTYTAKSPDTVVHEYHDQWIREIFYRHNATDSYDSPQKHRNGHLFVPNEEILASIEITAVQNGNTLDINDPNSSVTSNPADMIAAEAQTAVDTDNAQPPAPGQPNRGLEAQFDPQLDFSEIALSLREEAEQTEEQLASGEITRLLELLRNPGPMPLDTYYDQITQFTRNYSTDHSWMILEEATRERLFYYGHLAAPDAFSTEDRDHLERTKRFTIEALQHLFEPQHISNPDEGLGHLAFAMLTTHIDKFVEYYEFQDFIRRTDFGDPREQTILKILLEGEYNFDYDDIREDDDILDNLAVSEIRIVKMWALWRLHKDFDRSLPEDEISFLLQCLENDDETEDPAVWAIKLIRDQDIQSPELSAALSASAAQEDHPIIGATAAIIQLERGELNREDIQSVRENKETWDLNRNLRNRLQSALQETNCADELADHAEDDDE